MCGYGYGYSASPPRPVRQGSPDPVYDPLSLGPNLLAWWTADNATSLTLVGSQASAWRDVKNGFEVAQTTSSARPTFASDGFGGAPALVFDGTDDCLQANSTFNFPVGAAPGEIWTVVSQDALVSDTGAKAIVSYGSVATSRRALRRDVLGGTNRARLSVGSTSGEVVVSETTNDFLGRHVLRGVVGATASSISIDGNPPMSDSVIPNTSIDRIRIGAFTASNPMNFWHGAIRDLIVTSPLDAEQSEQLRTFLLARRMI